MAQDLVFLGTGNMDIFFNERNLGSDHNNPHSICNSNSFWYNPYIINSNYRLYFCTDNRERQQLQKKQCLRIYLVLWLDFYVVPY